MSAFSRILAPTTNGPAVAWKLVQLLNVKLSFSTIKKELETHPDYPSLLSISDVLQSYGIENLGIKVDIEKLKEAPTPFITQLKDDKNGIDSFTVVTSVGNTAIRFLDPEKHKWADLSYELFLKRCTGIILLAEAGENAGEREYEDNVKKERRERYLQATTAVAIPLLIILAGALAFYQQGIRALLPVAFAGITLAGCVTGALLIWHELDQHNPLLQKICSGGKKINCAAVLRSGASKIAGISWSIIGCSYFMGMLLLQLILGITNSHVLFTLAWVNVLAIPYVFFSLFYQWRIARQWCTMCLTVQALLLLQLATALKGGWHLLRPANAGLSDNMLQSAAAFLISFIAIMILVPALQRGKNGKHLQLALQRLKHDPLVFEALLRKQKMVTENPEGLGILLGNPHATYKVIKVCNPYCGPCAQAHGPIEALLRSNPDIQVQIVFTSTNYEGDVTAHPAKHLLAIAERNNAQELTQALDDWYLAEKKDYTTFAAKYPMNAGLKQQDPKIDAMQRWCSEMKIQYTPTFFVSVPGKDQDEAAPFYQIPALYTVTDLKYLLAV